MRHGSMSTTQPSGTTRCSQAPAQFGVIVPQDRISMSVTLEIVGKEKVKLAGVDRELLRVKMKDDSGPPLPTRETM